VDRKLDLLVIHVDCDVAREFCISMDCPPAQPTAALLRDQVISSWLDGAPDDPPIVVVSPSRSTDAWMLIGIDDGFWPRGNPPIEIECDDGLNGELIRRHFARNYRGRAKKFPERYVDSVSIMENNLSIVLRKCREAQIFVHQLEASGLS
jgi:hypothetical protein